MSPLKAHKKLATIELTRCIVCKIASMSWEQGKARRTNEVCVYTCKHCVQTVISCLLSHTTYSSSSFQWTCKYAGCRLQSVIWYSYKMSKKQQRQPSTVKYCLGRGGYVVYMAISRSCNFHDSVVDQEVPKTYIMLEVPQAIVLIVRERGCLIHT